MRRRRGVRTTLDRKAAVHEYMFSEWKIPQPWENSRRTRTPINWRVSRNSLLDSLAHAHRIFELMLLISSRDSAASRSAFRPSVKIRENGRDNAVIPLTQCLVANVRRTTYTSLCVLDCRRCRIRCDSSHTAPVCESREVSAGETVQRYVVMWYVYFVIIILKRCSTRIRMHGRTHTYTKTRIHMLLYVLTHTHTKNANKWVKSYYHLFLSHKI